MVMMKNIAKEIKVNAETTVKVGGAERKVAFAEGINRAVNFVNAHSIYEDMQKHGYRKAELVQVMPAEEAIANGDITLVDLNGQAIPNGNASEYYLVADGQHRIMAVAMWNAELAEQGKELISVPAVAIELAEGETFAHYVTAINVTKNQWKVEDYVRGAANVKNAPILVRYKELGKSATNTNGFPVSTLTIIFFNNNKAITQAGFELLCEGQETKGKDKMKIIPNSYNIDRGNKFIALCKSKGFDAKDIAKRYLPKKFSDLYNQGQEEMAFGIFSMKTENNRQAM